MGLNFPSDTWESWLMTQREHYQQRGLEAMSLLRDAQLARGEWDAVLEVAQRQLTVEPWLEAAHRALMAAQYHLGERTSALAQYEQCQQVLWDELRVEPEEETQQLHQQIVGRTLVAAEQVDIPDNLPQQTGRFFGREAEQALLLQRLVDPNYPLITLVGAGSLSTSRSGAASGSTTARHPAADHRDWTR